MLLFETFVHRLVTDAAVAWRGCAQPDQILFEKVFCGRLLYLLKVDIVPTSGGFQTYLLGAPQPATVLPVSALPGTRTGHWEEVLH